MFFKSDKKGIFKIILTITTNSTKNSCSILLIHRFLDFYIFFKNKSYNLIFKEIYKKYTKNNRRGKIKLFRFSR